MTLDSYLESLLRDGKHDSSGAFTVDFVRLKHLLGSALFEHPGNYLLKLVQSALASYPECVRVQMTRDTVQLSYAPRLDLPSLEAVEEMLRNPLHEQPMRALHHLSLALQAAVARQPVYLVWGRRDTTGGEALLIGFPRGQVQRIQLPPGQRLECIFQLKRAPYARSVMHRFLGIHTQNGEDARRLCQGCAFSPIPIYLDGRLVNLPQFGRLSREGSGWDVLVERQILSREPLVELMLAPPPSVRQAAVYDFGAGKQELKLSNGSVYYQWSGFAGPESLYDRSPKPFFKAKEYSFLEGRSVLVGRARNDPKAASPCFYVPDFDRFTRPDFAVSYHLFVSDRPLAVRASLLAPTQAAQSQSRLYIVQEGVVLEPHELDLDLPGMQVYVADNRLATDLSGMRVLEDERFVELVEWIQEQSVSMRKEARGLIRWGEKLSIGSALLGELRQLLDLENL